jgi:hypothetical protein
VPEQTLFDQHWFNLIGGCPRENEALNEPLKRALDPRRAETAATPFGAPSTSEHRHCRVF